MLGEHHRQADAGIAGDPAGQRRVGGGEEEFSAAVRDARDAGHDTRGGEYGIQPVQRGCVVGRGEHPPDLVA